MNEGAFVRRLWTSQRLVGKRIKRTKIRVEWGLLLGAEEVVDVVLLHSRTSGAKRVLCHGKMVAHGSKKMKKKGPRWRKEFMVGV